MNLDLNLNKNMRRIKILLLAEYIDNSEMSFPPLNIGSLASFLKQNHKDVKIYFYQDYNQEEIIQFIKKEKPDIVGMSCNSHNRINCFKMTRIIKSINPNTYTVLGGIHATFFHKQILEKISSIDFIVRGEGEISFFELISRIEKKEKFLKLPGISYRDKEKIIINPSRPFIKNLDILPFISPEIFDINEFKPSLYWTLQMSRGCPFSCKFCGGIDMWKRCFRSKSVEYVVNELEFLKNKYINKFFFADPIFTFDSKRIIRLCRYIIEKKLKIKWVCFSRPDTVSKILLELMQEAGCEYIFYGVESFSDRILKKMNRNYSANKAICTLNLTQQIGIKPMFSIIVGFPGETKKTLMETLANFKKLQKGIKCYNAHILSPDPGSPLYFYFKKCGIINDSVWFTDFEPVNFIKFIYNKSLLDAIYRAIKEIENFS